jgi:pyruvate formate lyase activating enzyme
MLEKAPVIELDMLIETALRKEVRCICFFGGSPEPHFPFALRAAEILMRLSGNRLHICWEWNGAGHPALVKRAAELSYLSGGTVKFDLKAWDRKLHLALCGVENRRPWENFRMLAQLYTPHAPDLLTATTLLVPYYVNGEEVEKISRTIGNMWEGIPYSLLVFHPDFCLDDLPITPASQVRDCLSRAKKYLKRVHVGNLHLLGRETGFYS